MQHLVDEGVLADPGTLFAERSDTHEDVPVADVRDGRRAALPAPGAPEVAAVPVREPSEVRVGGETKRGEVLA